MFLYSNRVISQKKIKLHFCVYIQSITRAHGSRNVSVDWVEVMPIAREIR